MIDLVGRTAVVTGASRGIGLAVATALAAEKMNLVLAARTRGSLENIVDRFPQGTQLTTVVGDLADRPTVQDLICTATQYFGAVDVLINNAGVERFCSFEKIPLGEIQNTIQINLISAMQLTRLAIPVMLQRGFGRIINISSLSAKAGQPCGESYVASKAGIVTFTESLRAEYHGTGVSASVICPGFVNTDMFNGLLANSGLQIPWLLGASSPETVAHAVIRAIKKDSPEVIVNPSPVRFLTAFAEFSPRLAEHIQKRLGIFDWFKDLAKNREKHHNESARL